MEIQITGHHLHITPAIRRHVSRRLKKVENHVHLPTTTDVVVHRAKTSWTVEATVRGPRVTIHAKSEAEDVFAAIDSISHKLDRQLLKHKERLTSRGRSNGKMKNAVR